MRTVLAYREEIKLLLRQHRARLVDFTGDNFLAEFGSVANAVQCAIQIQRTTGARNAELPADRRVEFRMGVHLGDVQVEGEQIFGDGLNIAARLEGLADPGAICISATVHDQVKRGLDLGFLDLGIQKLKNIPDPVHLYQVSWSDSPSPKERVVVRAEREPAVAVLPFVNMSSDPDQEFFADGMAEELINALTQVAGLRVIARTSAFSFKGTNADIATIGKRLDVPAVVEGSVRKAGNRLRITAQLIDVAGGHHLWSEVFDRPADDVFEIQDEIARKIVMTIRPKLLGAVAEPLVTRPTESQEAYALYLRAGSRVRSQDRWDLRSAIEMLRDATTIDPSFADAWARLALVCCWLEFDLEPDGQWGEEAERALARAFELDPNNPSAQCARGRTLWTPRSGWRNRDALRALASSLKQQPGSIDALVSQGLILLHVGLMDEAREALTEALSAEPADAMILNFICGVAWYEGHFAEACEYVDRSLAANPTLLINHIVGPAVRIYHDDLSGAQDALERARKLLGDDAALDASEALLWAKRGEVKRADGMIALAEKNQASVGHGHHTEHYVASAQAILGRPSEAIAKIRLASQTGLPNYPLFRSDPHLASLRDHPEMKSFMSELEADWDEFRREFGRP